MKMFEIMYEYRDVLYAHRPKILFPLLLVDKILMEMNRYCAIF